MKKSIAFVLLPVAAVLLAGCAADTARIKPAATVDYDKLTSAVVAASFQARGIATLDRLTNDPINAVCAAAQIAGQPLSEKEARAIEEASMKTIKWPTDGKFIGDWKLGEVIAQSGRGLTWTDTAAVVNGGNCYNCHKISQEEISFGTLGPSLFNYGKLRGVTDPNSAAARPIVEYTWGKLWNARAFNACSEMPRTGHLGILTQEQLQHVMALLLDPASPVNR